MRRILKGQPRLALGMKIALAVMAQGKLAAASPNLAGNTLPSADLSPSDQKAAIGKFLVEQAEQAVVPGSNVISAVRTAWDAVVEKAAEETHVAAPMSYEEARLWLQSYNAGPYALLKYKGNVPYKETRNYVPRVMKYYQQDLSNTPYDDYIVECANKYGLDPQMIRAIMKTESNFRNRTVSHAGARGLMQVMPVVWSEIKKRYKLDWNYSSQVFEPKKNIEVACAYLAWLRYDFLPKHFVEFEPNPKAPVALVRDKSRTSSRRIETAKVEAPAKDKKVTANQSKSSSRKSKKFKKSVSLITAKPVSDA